MNTSIRYMCFVSFTLLLSFMVSCCDLISSIKVDGEEKRVLSWPEGRVVLMASLMGGREGEITGTFSLQHPITVSTEFVNVTFLGNTVKTEWMFADGRKIATNILTIKNGDSISLHFWLPQVLRGGEAVVIRLEESTKITCPIQKEILLSIER